MDNNTANEAVPRAGRREWIGLAVLALPTLLLSLDVSVLYLALPSLSADLGADSTQQLWIIDIYSFMLAGFLVTMGTLGDRIGRRQAAADRGRRVRRRLGASPPTRRAPEMLIAARALLGVAGATLMPSTMALIRNMFHDPRQMADRDRRLVRLLHGRHGPGPAGRRHAAGALLVGLGVPARRAVHGAAARGRPGAAARVPGRERRGRLDLASVALSLAAILPVIYGLKELARERLGGAARARHRRRRRVRRRVRAAAAAAGQTRCWTSSLFANRSFSSRARHRAARRRRHGGASRCSPRCTCRASAGSRRSGPGCGCCPQNVAMVARLPGRPACSPGGSVRHTWWRRAW